MNVNNAFDEAKMIRGDSPEVRTLRELESHVRSQDLTLRAWIDGEGVFRVQATKREARSSHFGSAADMQGAVTAALEAVANGAHSVRR